MMMMAHDSTPPHAGLGEETIRTVRVALIEYLDGADDGGDGLHHALNRMAGEAREKAILPEQLLIILKDVWYGLPALKAAPDHQRAALLQRAVTICIKEYYGD